MFKTMHDEISFVGLGSTRKVFKCNDYVIKYHLNDIGLKQSLREQEIYHDMKALGYDHIFAPVYYVNDQFSVQRYYREMPLIDHQSFDIKETKGFWHFPDKYDECLKILDSKWDTFDIKDSSNYGLKKSDELILIDYGMSRTLYEQEWVPAVERGEIPQIEVHACQTCSIKKEIRIYGENDTDIRCLACGKE